MGAASSPPGRGARSSRIALALALAGIGTAFALAWSPLVLAAALACSDDDGVPFAARDSVVGMLCELRASGLGPVSAVLAFGSPFVLLGIGLAAIARRSPRLMVMGAGVAFGTLGLGTLPWIVLPTS